MQSTKVKNIVLEIDELISHKFKNLIQWDELTEWKLNESRELNGTINTKVIHSKNHIRFITQIPPKFKFEKHWHNVAECCTILAGELYCPIKNRFWRVNEQAIFSAGEKHAPQNISETNYVWLAVDFYY